MTNQKDHLAAIKVQGWRALKYIKEQTPAICLSAVNQSGFALEYVKGNIPNKIDLDNPKQKPFYPPAEPLSPNGDSPSDLGWRDGDLNRICLEAVQKDGFALKFVKRQTPAICLMAVQQHPSSLYYVNSQIPDKIDPANPKQKLFFDLGWKDGDLSRLYLMAVQKDGYTLQYVKQQTPELCLAAVQQNERVLQYVQDLPSIASLIDQSILDEVLLLDQKKYQNAIKNAQVIMKIREAHQITERLNEAVAPAVNPLTKKVRL